MADDNKSPSIDEVKDAKPTQTAPDSSESGKAQDESTEAPSQLPEKFKGKSADEIVKAYVELEKKLGEQSKTVEESRKLKEETDTMLRAIWSNPDLYRQVEEGINKYISGETLPDTKKPSKKDGGEEAKNDVITSQISDMRRAQENRILNEFFTKFGYNNLPQDKRQEKNKTLVLSLAEMIDPGGKKPLKQILSEVSLDKLPKYLENAHFLANKEDLIEQGKTSALISAEENRAASIGSFSATSNVGKSDSVSLTKREREVAQKMGISDEDYAKQKLAMAKEAEQFE